MTSVTSIVAGKVENRGINDVSIPEYTPARTTRPLHSPVIHGVFPKGQLADENGIVWVNTSQVSAVFGSEIFDPLSPYYNPTSVLLQRLQAGGQATVGIRRLSANKVVATTPLSAFVQRVTVQDYKRDATGQFVRDETGELVPNPGVTFDGVNIVIKIDPDGVGKGPGVLKRRKIEGKPADGDTPAVPDTEVFPLMDGVAGVGDFYNRGGMNFGVAPNSFSFGEVANFVKDTGCFPFSLRTFSDTDSGRRVNMKTQAGREVVEVTLFDTTSKAGVRYGLKRAFGEFTGTNANRKVVPIPAPYSGVHVYAESITALCQALYAIEKPHNTALLETGKLPYRQMNPFTCVNHNNVPYYAITTEDTINWDMTAAVKVSGGISPFFTAEGKLPDFVTPTEVDDPFNVLADYKAPVSVQEAWDVNNGLIAADMETYVTSIEQANVVRNRQSVFWDIGYSQDVKEQAIRLLGARKDIIVIPCTTIWTPGKFNNVQQMYARASQLNNQMRMFPESDFWGTPSTRGSINLIEAYAIDEATGNPFSGNVDLAYAFALFAGNAAGMIIPSASPSHGDNRILRTMHSPSIEFEEDVQSAENFTRGCITLRPYDTTDQLFRPALVTINPNVDSVIKDLVTAFLCVCAEKIAQDEWNRVCGDTNYTAANYVSVYKDGAERQLRDRLGSLVRNITVTPSYLEGVVGSKAVMQVRIDAYFNKAKYQMTLDLFAHNEEELANA